MKKIFIILTLFIFAIYLYGCNTNNEIIDNPKSISYQYDRYSSRLEYLHRRIIFDYETLEEKLKYIRITSIEEEKILKKFNKNFFKRNCIVPVAFGSEEGSCVICRYKFIENNMTIYIEYETVAVEAITFFIVPQKHINKNTEVFCEFVLVSKEES